jgi:DNA-directed RNA polymerase subunit RPC12/RpoP
MTKWKPNYAEEYFVPYINFGKPISSGCVWLSRDDDHARYDAGIVFQTAEEASRVAQKMLMVAKDSPVNSRDNPLTAYRYVYNGHEIKCPNCSGELVWDYYDEQEYGKINYCPYCGQRINVVDTEDDEEESHE